MPRTLRMMFDGQVFRPNESVDLPAGTEYEVTIHDSKAEPSVHDRPLMKYLDLAQDVDLPPDFAAQHHHYLHVTAKR